MVFTSEQLAQFSELEYILYNYISANTDKVIFMRIRELADATHVSNTSILRFCRKLGCEGFSEFKVMLKLELEKNKKLKLSSDPQSITEFLERTINRGEETGIKQAARLIAKSDNVLFIGAGSSGILAEYGARYFSSLKKFSLHIKDPFFPFHGHFLKNSTAVVLSVSGKTPSILGQVHRLKEGGSTIISLTNQTDNPLSSMADFSLNYFVTPEYMENANVTTQIPVIYYLESLAKETYMVMESGCLYE